MAAYKIAGNVVDQDSTDLQKFLEHAYKQKERPFCQCRPPGIEMYISKVHGKYIVKRMPNSADDHSALCDSYDPPHELSGLGQVLGSAIQEDPAAGMTNLKFDFTLSKGKSRSSSAQSMHSEKPTVKTDGNKLSLRGTLHYLWEQAGFNRWSPSMSGKRTWYVVRKHLLQAADDKQTKSLKLCDLLYIPEPFAIEKKDDIIQRRNAHFSKRVAQPGKLRQLMLVVGEVKEIAESRYGRKIVLKHSPDFHFMLNDDIYKRLTKRFEMEIGLRNAMDDSHLMMIGTFWIGNTGVASLEEISLMIVNHNWIPFNNTFDKQLIDLLSHDHRRFMVGLRYNLSSAQPMASAVLLDGPEPTAMYLMPPGADEEYVRGTNELIATSKLDSWVWDVTEDMPSIPSIPRSEPPPILHSPINEAPEVPV